MVMMVTSARIDPPISHVPQMLRHSVLSVRCGAPHATPSRTQMGFPQQHKKHFDQCQPLAADRRNSTAAMGVERSFKTQSELDGVGALKSA